MSSVKIRSKELEARKNVRKKIKESFSNIKDSINSGRINIVRTLSGLIHCQYDEHPPIVYISAPSDKTEDGYAVERYLKVSDLSQELQIKIVEELKEKFATEIKSDEELKEQLEEACLRNTKV